MKTCEEIHGRLWAFLDDELDAAERAEVAAHLGRCADCARELEGGRALLETVRASVREPAPPSLVARVEAIARGEGAPATTSGPRPGRRSWAVLAPLAAILAALLIARPWAGDGGEALAAPGFLADHAAHAEAAPSAQPFRPDETTPPGPPALSRGRLAGLSRCVVDGRAYAHWTFEVEGGRVSAYVPVEGRLPESLDPLAAGGAAVARVGSGDRAMVLVSTDLDAEALRALSPDA